MAWQLIYTSAPRGLVAGRSGFCTVARHREIRDGLVTAIERFSQYDRAGRTAGTPNPVIYAYRIVRLGGSTYHVLSCTRDAGADYTGRTNHLAHHFICEPHELATAPSPAEVLRQTAWLRTWTGEPRYFGAEEMVALSGIPRSVELPARSWQAITGDAGCAALPLESGALGGASWLYPAEAGETFLLPLFAESLLLLDPPGHSAEKFWQIPFTTYLQSTDHAADFIWRGCAFGSPAALAAQGARQILDLTQPRQLRPPASKTAELARTGRTAPPDPEPAAPAAREPDNFPPSTAPAPPAAAAPSGEIDLAELLASADDAKLPKGKWARSKSGATAESSDAGRGSGSRRLPVKLLIAAGAVVLLGGVLATGFVMWRDGKAEQARAELHGLRYSGKIADAQARSEKIWRILRGHPELKIEVERTAVAVELDRLQTPEEANRYLAANRAKLESSSIGEEDRLKPAIASAERWAKAGNAVAELRAELDMASLREPAMSKEIKERLAGVEKSIEKLDAPYRPTVTQDLAIAKRLYVRRRVQSLESQIETGALPNDLERAIADLQNDAKDFGSDPELDSRITKLDEQRPKMAIASTSAPQVPAVVTSPEATVAPKENSLVNSWGLPKSATYIALSSAGAFDVSGVKETSGGSTIPQDGKWLLFRKPEPVLVPQGAPVEEGSIAGSKFYVNSVRGAEFFALRPPQLLLSPHAREGFRGQALLRFESEGTPASGFQVLLLSAEPVASLLRLPIKGHLVRRENTVNLDDKLASACVAIKPASANAAFVLRRSANRAAAASYQALKLDLSEEMKSAESQVAYRKNVAAGPEASLKQAKAIESERAKLLGLLNDVGIRLFRGYTRMEKKDGEKPHQVPEVDGKHQVAGIKRFLKRGDEVVPFNTDKQLVDYFQEILWTLGKLDTERQKEIDAIRDKIKHEWENIRKPEAMVQVWRTVPALAGKNVKAIEEEKRTRLDKFCNTWEKLFSEENVPTILAFFRGSGVEVAKAIKDAEAKWTPAQAELAKAQAALDRLKADLPEIGPFFLDLEFPGPNPALPPQVVRLIEFSESSVK